MSDAAIEEPVPVESPRSEKVLTQVLISLLDSGRGSLAADLIARAELGQQRYGTYLMSHNGRNALMDLYQELLDALMYCVQWEMESDLSLTHEFWALRDLAMHIKAKLAEQAVRA